MIDFGKELNFVGFKSGSLPSIDNVDINETKAYLYYDMVAETYHNKRPEDKKYFVFGITFYENITIIDITN